MRIQLEPVKHETRLTQLRTERHCEDKRLMRLKTRLQDTLTRKQPTLFAVHTDGRVDAA
jgi:hypothetical protein